MGPSAGGSIKSRRGKGGTGSRRALYKPGKKPSSGALLSPSDKKLSRYQGNPVSEKVKGLKLRQGTFGPGLALTLRNLEKGALNERLQVLGVLEKKGVLGNSSKKGESQRGKGISAHLVPSAWGGGKKLVGS